MQAKESEKNMLRDHVLQIVQDIENGYKPDADEREILDYPYEDGDILSGFDYLSDLLDIQYIVTGKREYLGARILVAFGGPNIWINTQAQIVEGYWWGDAVSMSYHDDPMGIDEACQELWEMGV